MSDRALRAASATFAAVGALIAGYLLWSRWSGASPMCATGGCETVQSSRYSELVGVPVAAVGLAGYGALLAVSLARGEAARTAGAALGLAALLFGAYLLYVQLALVGAVCQWCLASDVVTAVLATLALLRLRPTR